MKRATNVIAKNRKDKVHEEEKENEEFMLLFFLFPLSSPLHMFFMSFVEGMGYHKSPAQFQVVTYFVHVAVATKKIRVDK